MVKSGPETPAAADPPAWFAAETNTTPFWSCVGQPVPAIRTPLMHSPRMLGLGRTLPARLTLAPLRNDVSARIWIEKPLKLSEPEMLTGTFTLVSDCWAVTAVPPLMLTRPVIEARETAGTSNPPSIISCMINSVSSFFKLF